MKYLYTDINNDLKSVETNLAGESFDKLFSKEWDLGFICDNPLLGNDENDTYYQTEKDEISDTHVRCFKNKVTVTLCNGSVKTGHIIHWVENEGYFCITYNRFWDQFDEH